MSVACGLPSWDGSPRRATPIPHPPPSWFIPVSKGSPPGMMRGEQCQVEKESSRGSEAGLLREKVCPSRHASDTGHTPLLSFSKSLGEPQSAPVQAGRPRLGASWKQTCGSRESIPVRVHSGCLCRRSQGHLSQHQSQVRSWKPSVT